MTTYKADFFKDIGTRQCHTDLFSSWDDLHGMIDWAEVVLFSLAKHYNSAADYAREKGKVILQHLDVTAMHTFLYNPDIIAVRGAFDVQRIMRETGLPRDAIEITGCTQLDQAVSTKNYPSREAFCAEYGLDPEKKIALFVSTCPAGHRPSTQSLYKRVCDIVKESSGHALIIKPHPREYGAVKQDVFYGDSDTPPWECYSPGVPACRQEDGIDAFRYCDVIIAQMAWTCFEAALFRKPTIYVDMPEFWFAASIASIGSERLRKNLLRRRYSPPGRRTWFPLGNTLLSFEGIRDGEIRDALRKAVLERMGGRMFSLLPEYVGCECSVDELADVLNAGKYRIDDQEIFDDYADTYFCGRDGSAYKRIADMVERSSELLEMSRRRGEKHQRLKRSVLRRIGRAACRAAGALKRAFSGQSRRVA
ncbi:MAG TPA: hypothetical protein ENI69_03505 [Rhodospirillales bacterium]|nr:hypothetical protein [Rhodospirillales bacterium]